MSFYVFQIKMLFWGWQSGSASSTVLGGCGLTLGTALTLAWHWLVQTVHNCVWQPPLVAEANSRDRGKGAWRGKQAKWCIIEIKDGKKNLWSLKWTLLGSAEWKENHSHWDMAMRQYYPSKNNTALASHLSLPSTSFLFTIKILRDSYSLSLLSLPLNHFTVHSNQALFLPL